IDALEEKMGEVLLRHLRTRLGLIREAEMRFRGLRFDWLTLAPSHLLYQAELDWKNPRCPRLAMRLLVQCTPYDVLQEDMIVNLLAHVTGAQAPCQYAVLVHPIATNASDKLRLLRESRGHLLLLTPSEIDMLPSFITLSTGGAV